MMRIFLMLAVCLFLATVVLADAPEKDSDRIKQLEQKIEELEKQLAALKEQPSSAEIEEIRRQLTILAAEVEKLRTGETEVKLEEAKRRSLGLGPSAAAVYSKKEGASLAGYGEMLYENFDNKSDSGGPSGRTDQIDFLRAVVYLGYRFNGRFLFNSEIEFEHASTGEDGEVSVEFAHVDYAAKEDLTLRAGLVLVPIGFLNELHEPTSFLGTHRTFTESAIIPTTWRENGFGIVGRKGIVDYRAYLINGFNAAGFLSSGLREGKQDGARAKIENPAFVGRVDINPKPGLLIGGSFYGGNSGVFGTSVPTKLKVGTWIGEGHLEYKRRGWEVRGLYAQASLDHVAQLNQVIGATGNLSVGSTLRGGYLQAGYNLWAGRGKGNALLTPYLRYESINTQADVPAGFTMNPARDQSIWTLGLQYKPILNIVVKTDYQAINNEANNAVDQWNIALGYSF